MIIKTYLFLCDNCDTTMKICAKSINEAKKYAIKHKYGIIPNTKKRKWFCCKECEKNFNNKENKKCHIE